MYAADRPSGVKSGLLLSSGLGVPAIICSMEMLRHRDGGHWQGQDFHSFSLFFPAKNRGLSLSATGSHRSLESCGQQLVVGAAQRSRPCSLPPALPLALAGAVPSERRCWALEDAGEDHGPEPAPAQPLWGLRCLEQAVRVLCWHRTRLAPVGPSCSLQDWGGRLPAASGERGHCFLGVPSLQTRLGFPSLPPPSLSLPHVPSGLISPRRQAERMPSARLAASRTFSRPARWQGF